ncbi:MAG: acyloxyacyl hydrolase [Verrucomicrobiota bacterium]
MVIAALPSSGRAGCDHSKSLTVAAVEVDPFAKGMREFTVGGGYFWSPVIATGGRPTLNYVQGDLALGWMLTSPSAPWGETCLRGNWELLLNAFGTGITEGPGGYLAGGRLLVRYNFVQPSACFVPFFQLGGGGLFNDVHRHQDQHLIGGEFEFTLVADLGVRYFFTPRCALVLAGDYEHISNAGTASRNLGVNAAGATIGVSCFF